MRNSLSDATGEVRSFSSQRSAVVGRVGIWGGGSLAGGDRWTDTCPNQSTIMSRLCEGGEQTAERTFFRHLVLFLVTHDGRSRIKVIVPRGAFKNLLPVLT